MPTGINGVVEFTYHRFLYLRNFTSSSYKDLSVSQAGREGPNIIEPRVDQKRLLTILQKQMVPLALTKWHQEPCDPCVVSGIR